MIQQRLKNRSLLQIVVPAMLVLAISGAALLNGRTPDIQPRESVFDLFERLHARPAVTPDVALITIDAESLDRIGPWPWPRSALAGLVTAATDAGAGAVVVSIPVDGEDPLSPEVAARYWRRTDRGGEVDRVLGQLPTNNAALAAASKAGKTAIAVGKSPVALGPWTRTDALGISWGKPATEGATGFVALRAAPHLGRIDPGFDETALVAVSSLPTDGDGQLRRTPLLWARGELPAPSVALAGVVLAKDIQPALGTASRKLRSGGAPVDRIVMGDAIPAIALDPNGAVRLWLPKDLTLPTVPAWRALEGSGNWTQPLEGRIVFIGETVSPRADLDTARGALPVHQIHAHVAEQLLSGALPHRPQWAGLAEAALALLIGAAALFCALALRPLAATLVATLLAVLSFSGGYFLFQQTELLLSPVPLMVAAAGAPLAALAVHIFAMLRGGDIARATFHGTLPARTVARLQAQGAGRLLDGTRRDVTILSCGLRLPDAVRDAYANRPNDFVSLTGSVTDALRRTILAAGGTVDFGEDGRLLGYWNVPEVLGDPIEKACGCALKMIEEMNRLADDLQSASFAGADTGGFADAKLEIGIASGACFAGAVGHGTRRRYAVMGEAVRIASALRQRAALYGPAIITDDVVFDTLRHQYAFLDLDVVKLPEDDTVRTVYGLSGNSFLKASKAFRVLADTQRELVLSWRNQDIAATTIQLQKLRGIPGVPDAYVDLYDMRLRELHRRATEKTVLAETLPL